MHGNDASIFDALAQHRRQRCPQVLKLGAGQGIGWSQRVDAVDKQCLGAIDVAHSAENALIQQRRCNRDRPFCKALPCSFGVGVMCEQVRTEAFEDFLAPWRVDQLAGGGADEVNVGGGGSQSELHARSGWECRFAKTADQSEVDMQDRRVAPVVEEMLAEGLYVVENVPIQHRRQIWMPP